MGRGGAGFRSPGPALTTGRGGYFGGDPGPAHVRGESPLIPSTGPHFSPPVSTGTSLGTGWGRGRGREPSKSTPRPGPFSGSGRGIGPGAHVFRGPEGPVKNTSPRPATGDHTTTRRSKYARRWFPGIIQVAPQEAVTLTPLIYPANSFWSVGQPQLIWCCGSVPMNHTLQGSTQLHSRTVRSRRTVLSRRTNAGAAVG